MEQNYIYIGSVTSPTFYFANEQLMNVNANMSLDAIGNELAIDTLQFEVNHDDADRQLREMKYGTPIWYYNGSKIVGKFYFKNIERIGKTVYKVDAVSMIGLLEYEKHYGGMFTSKNVKEAVEETLLTDGVTPAGAGDYFYEYAQSLRSTTSIKLRDNEAGFGDSAESSGRTTSVYIKFQITEWLTDTSGFVWGGSWRLTSSGEYLHMQVIAVPSGPYIAIRCGDNTQYNIYPQLNDVIEIAMHPGHGRLYAYVNGQQALAQSFTAQTATNEIFPLYNTAGRYYVDGSSSDWPTTHIYRLYRLCIFRESSLSDAGIRPSGNATVYLDLTTEKSTTDTYFVDKVTGARYLAADYTAGGEKTRAVTKFYEYAQCTTRSGSNMALKTDWLGDSVESSGTNTSVYIKVKANDLINAPGIWYNSFVWAIDAQNDNFITYNFGINIYNNSNANPTSELEAQLYMTLRSYNGGGIDEGGRVNVQINVGDVLEFALHPKYGKIVWRVNGGEINSYQSQYYAIGLRDIILPMYSLQGVTSMWNSGTHQPYPYSMQSYARDHNLYRLCLFTPTSSDSAGLAPTGNIYLDLEAAMDSNNTTLLHDKVSDTYYTPNGYTAGGAETGDTISIYERAVDSLIWQDGVDALTFSGWIPAGTKRETLHQILFALNLNLYKSENGDMIIGRLPSGVSKTISNDEIYDSGSTEDVKKPKQIELTENAYTTPSQASETKTVFDNSAITTPEGKYIAEFSGAPIYGTPVGSGLTIYEYNANAALVSGKGTISAKTYTRSTRVITEQVSSRPDGDTVSVSDATLVTFLNSENVMEKLLAYYANNAYRIKNAIVGNGELVGRKYTLKTPFDETEDAYLVSANVVGSSIAKLNCEFLTGYTPVSSGGTYNNVIVISQNQSWTAPAGTEKIHVVLIGGGSGGESGYAGEDGSTSNEGENTSPAKGGNYGANGANGKIYSFDVTNPSGTYTIYCGSGGNGGAYSESHEQNNPGTSGEPTTFSGNGVNETSASGSVSADGYTDPMTGNVYAAPMPTWNEESGKGGDSGWHEVSDPEGNGRYLHAVYHKAQGTYNFMTGYRNDPGDINGGNVPGIVVNRNYPVDYETDVTTPGRSKFGDGGGAGYGEDDDANGGNGGAWEDREDLGMYGGYGGDSVYVPPSPLQYNPYNYGSGGMGGVGGGGGGSGGYVVWGGSGIDQGHGGEGGHGGMGGHGAQGCVIIYY